MAMSNILWNISKAVGEILKESFATCMSNTLGNFIAYEHNLKCLERKSESLSGIISDVEDLIQNGEASGKKKRKKEVDDWLEEAQNTQSQVEELFQREVDNSATARIWNRISGSNEVVELSSRVDKLIQQRRDIGEQLLVDNYEKDTLVTSELIGIAWKIYMHRIIQCVTHKVSIIGIYGMGGVGKTTLAKHIHNLLLKEHQQMHVYWVTVSQEYDLANLQEGIAKQMGVDLSDESDVIKRAAKIYVALSKKKDFVLLLDDVWDDIGLENVGVPVGPDHEGATVIVTTRSLQVCRRVGCEEIFEVKTLEKQEAWNLFRSKLGPKMTLSPQVEEIAKLVAQECDGLPLGIITIAGSMRGETSIHVWRDALTKLKSSLEGCDGWEEKVFRVLKCSFDRLNKQLQLCFLYCSLYPEDFHIDKEDLIQKFISENLLVKKQRRQEEFDQGYAVLKTLENFCLLETAEPNGVKMHDLLRDMALNISRNSPKLKVLAGLSLKRIPEDEEDWPEDVEKMSLMMNFIREIPKGMAPKCPKLSTFLLNSAFDRQCLPDSFFSEMLGLQVLDLSCNHIKELPASLSELERLNSLVVKDCTELVSVPNLGKIVALTELDFTGCTSIEQVPEGLENLVKLKFLSFFRTNVKVFPTGLLSKFRHLQSLRLPYQVHVPIHLLSQLKELEEFIGGLKDLQDLILFTALLKNKKHSHSYSIRVGPKIAAWSDNDDGVGDDDVVIDDDDYGDEIISDDDAVIDDDDDYGDEIYDHESPSYSTELKLYKCDGLSNCFMDDLRLLNNLTLESLNISSCRGIECVLRWRSINSKNEEWEFLSKLMEIKLERLDDLTSVVDCNDLRSIGPSPPLTPHGVIFSSLRGLTIFGCNKIKNLGLPLPELQNIEYISISECEEIEEIIQVGAEAVNEATLPKLFTLVLVDLPKLKSICDTTMTCNSLFLIQFFGCTSLKKLPLFGYYLPWTVRNIILPKTEASWWESLEWEHPFQKDFLQPLINWH